MNVLLGDTTKFTAQKIDDYTVVMKATTTELNAVTGIQVQLSSQQMVIMRITTDEGSKTVDNIQFFRGNSPYQSEINKEKKQLQKEFDQYKKEFTSDYARGAQKIILKEMQDHFYERKNLSVSKTVENINLDAKRYLEIGQYGYIFFEITNLTNEDINPQNSTLASVKRNGVGFVEIKDLTDVVYCDNNPLKKKQVAKCSIAFSLKDFSRKNEKLKISFLHNGEQNVTDVYVLNL